MVLQMLSVFYRKQVCFFFFFYLIGFSEKYYKKLTLKQQKIKWQQKKSFDKNKSLSINMLFITL